MFAGELYELRIGLPWPVDVGSLMYLYFERSSVLKNTEDVEIDLRSTQTYCNQVWLLPVASELEDFPFPIRAIESKSVELCNVKCLTCSLINCGLGRCIDVAGRCDDALGNYLSLARLTYADAV